MRILDEGVKKSNPDEQQKDKRIEN